jgi:adenylosuccinate lyase
MLNRFISLIEQLVVYPEQMEYNLNLTKGGFFSQAIMLKLVEKGLRREDAYRVVQRNAMKTWDEGRDFRNTISQDATVKNHLSKKEIDHCCNARYYLKHVDEIFARVFGQKR